jgi:hypothetical protein
MDWRSEWRVKSEEWRVESREWKIVYVCTGNSEQLRETSLDLAIAFIVKCHVTI